MQTRATCWSVTINNPTKSDEENISLARQRGWKVEGQLERGENGTPHYQLAVRTPQVRFSAVKKAFPRAHIEVARNSAALAQYVVKEETREAALTTEQSQFPSQQMVWQWFGSLNITKEYLHQQYGVYRNQCAEREVTALRYFDWHQEHMLERFDAMMSEKIAEGFYCELIAVNPQIRSAVKKFGIAICERHRRQTDRQTDENNISEDGITNDSEDNEEDRDEEACDEEAGAASSGAA